jgi:Amt family ammonium transporter
VISLGIFATTAANPAGADGLLMGNVSFFGYEILSVVLATAWAFIFSYCALAVINMFTPVRVSREEEVSGLDSSLHGEDAYIN